MNILLAVILAVLGSLLGSFACAQVWRLRARQLVDDKREGEAVDGTEYRRLKGLLRSPLHDRSECLSCHHKLAWYDLIPVVSWLSTRGRCRYCHSTIGYAEILAEIGLGTVFAISFLFWPYPLAAIGDISLFAIWLVGLVLLTILFIYDAKWSLLPFSINIVFILVAAIFWAINAWQHGADVASLGGALLLLAGLYLLFSLFGWVGMGDGILGIGLALMLGKWELAFLTLFVANLLGCCMLLPLMVSKRLHRHARIPFGPFLIIATVISMLWGSALIEWFMQVSSVSLMTLVL